MACTLRNSEYIFLSWYNQVWIPQSVYMRFFCIFLISNCWFCMGLTIFVMACYGEDRQFTLTIHSWQGALGSPQIVAPNFDLMSPTFTSFIFLSTLLEFLKLGLLNSFTHIWRGVAGTACVARGEGATPEGAWKRSGREETGRLWAWAGRLLEWEERQLVGMTEQERSWRKIFHDCVEKNEDNRRMGV